MFLAPTISRVVRTLVHLMDNSQGALTSGEIMRPLF